MSKFQLFRDVFLAIELMAEGGEEISKRRIATLTLKAHIAAKKAMKREYLESQTITNN